MFASTVKMGYTHWEGSIDHIITWNQQKKIYQNFHFSSFQPVAVANHLTQVGGREKKQ